VLARMNLVSARLPTGVTPTLGPAATGVGHVFWYTVEGGGLSLRDRRSLQDWFIRYQLNSVPGVAEVASVGGFVKQYQVDVDPNRLRGFGIPMSAVVTAVRESNRNVGGNVLEANGSWTIVRGVGLIESVADLEDIPLGSASGVPLYLKQVATVQIGDGFRVASLVKGGEEAVGGVVVARSGVNTRQVIDAVKARIAQIAPGLPPGVTIVPFYDRSQLIDRAVGTLRTALIEEVVLVTLAHVLFLMHFRSILIVTLPLPLAVLAAFIGMRYAGVSSNIMSLAGIAIAIGVLVAAGLVFAGAVFVGTRIGSEFMPPLNEGDLMFMPIADPSISLDENTRNAQRQNQALMQFPEVEYAVAKVARAETSTDPAPLNMTETVVHLKPPDQWRPGMTPAKLRAEMDRAVQFPGVSNIWTMPIVN